MTSVGANFVNGVRIPIGGGTITYTPVGLRATVADPAKTVAPIDVVAEIVSGVAQDKDLEPGPYSVRIEVEWFLETYPIVVPATGPVQLIELIEDSTPYAPPVVSLVKKYRDEMVSTAAAVDESLVVYTGRINGYTERSETASGAAKTAARTAGEDAAATARDREAIEAVGQAVGRDRATVVDVGVQVGLDRAAVEDTRTGITTVVADATTAFEEYRSAFTADREIAQRASGEATRQADRAETAAQDIAEGVVPDNAVTTPKIVDGAVTLSKTSIEVQAAIGKGQSAIQPGDLASAIAALQDQAPAALDTFVELAAAIGNDPNFRQSILDQIATRAADNDVLKLSEPQVVPSAKNFTDGLYVDEQRVVTTDDSRLVDARPPTAHEHRLDGIEGFDDLMGYLTREFERIQASLNAKVGSYPGQTIINFAGTQAAFDALPASEKTAAGFISVIY